MANPAAGEACDFDAQIIEEFRANSGRVGGPFADATVILIRRRLPGQDQTADPGIHADPPGLTTDYSRRRSAAPARPRRPRQRLFRPTRRRGLPRM